MLAPYGRAGFLAPRSSRLSDGHFVKPISEIALPDIQAPAELEALRPFALGTQLVHGAERQVQE